MRTPENKWPAEGGINNFTLRIQAMACQCDKPERINYETLNPNYKRRDPDFTLEERLDRGLPFGYFCNNCKKPLKYMIRKVLRYCEGCEKQYVPKPEKGTYPIKYFLCTDCDVPSRPMRRTSGSSN